MCVQRPLSTDSHSPLLCACSLSRSPALSHSIAVWLVPARLSGYFHFPFALVARVQQLPPAALCCAPVPAAASHFCSKPKRTKRWVRFSLSLSLSPIHSVSLKLNSVVKFAALSANVLPFLGWVPKRNVGCGPWIVGCGLWGWFSLLVLFSAFVSLQCCLLLLFVLAFHSQTVSKFCTFCAFISPGGRREVGRQSEWVGKNWRGCSEWGKTLAWMKMEQENVE